MTSTVLFTRERQIGIITFNRPDKMNAFSREMAREFEILVDRVKKDHMIRVLILCGVGEVFMAGSDLQEANSKLNTISHEVSGMLKHFNSSILALREMEIPVLASVHGLVTGTGMSLVLASDLVIASGNTRFSLGFSRVGTSPAGGVSYHLPRLVGQKKAMEWLLFSELLDVKTAEKWGLVNWVVPHDELQMRTKRIAEKLATGPTLAFSQTKQLVNSSWHHKMPQQLKLEASAFTRLARTHDFKSAVRAFNNKKQPEFEGR